MTATVSGASLAASAVKCQQKQRTVVRNSQSTLRRQNTHSFTVTRNALLRARPLGTLGARCSGQFVGVEGLRRSRKVTGVRRLRGTYCASNAKENDPSSSEPSSEAKSKGGEDHAEVASSSDPALEGAVASETAASETTTKEGPRELLARFWAWIVGIFSSLTIFHQRARKLKALKAECESDASNPEKEAIYLAELGKHEYEPAIASHA